MTDTRIVKIESILESQIPEFLSSESPLFKEFLTQYYISQTHNTGVLDIANNLSEYKNISTYTYEKIDSSSDSCFLIEDVLTFDDEIEVNTVSGFPDKYGLIQINDEIITYTGISKENNIIKFTGCIRGFSGVSEINYAGDSSGLVFTSTLAEEHESGSIVKNLSTIFYEKLFEKFKYHYLPDFENREFNPKSDLELILSRARDFYLTKGTDVSFKILFEILYNDPITVIKPQEYLIRASDDETLITRNILVEPLIGNFTPSDLIGGTIHQNLPSGVTASAAIYNVEFRPTDEFYLYEISLDLESFVYNFIPTKKTIILEKLSNSLIVDSTIGFPEEGIVYVKIKNEDLTYSLSKFNYSGKTINQFLNVTGITDLEYDSIKVRDEVIEDNFLEFILEDDSIVYFRLLNVIEKFDYSDVNTIQVNDIFYLSSFGENYTDKPEFTSWLYNYPTYHEIKSIDSNNIELKDSVVFTIGEKIDLINDINSSIEVEVTNIISNNTIEVNIPPAGNAVKVKKKIAKTIYTPEVTVNIQNTYFNEDNNSLIVATSGLPSELNLTALNSYSFNIVGVGTTTTDVFKTNNTEDNTDINHNLLSGNRIYISSNNLGLSTGQYYVKKIDDNKISLYKSTGDLYLSYSNATNASNPISIIQTTVNSIVGVATVLEYKDGSGNFSNQLLLKEFKVEETLYKNKINSSSPIYNIEQAYGAFS